MEKEKTKQTEAKVLSTKTYTIVIQDFEDGRKTMERTNDGFNPLELLGLADFIALEVRDQIIGRIKPTSVKRECIVP